MKSIMQTRVVILVMCLMAMFFIVSSSARAAISISENFNDLALDPGLEDDTVVYTHDLANARIPYAGPFRAYIRTTETDWNTTDFTYEVSYITSGNEGGYEQAYFGIGMADRDGSYYDMPTSAYFLQIWDGGFAINSKAAIGAPTQLLVETVPLMTQDGTEHRLRMTRSGDAVIWDFDAGYNGTFAADYSYSRSLSGDAAFLDATNSRLFFGTGSNSWYAYGRTTFDDVEMTVVPEPATLALLAVAGVAALRRRR